MITNTITSRIASPRSIQQMNENVKTLSKQPNTMAVAGNYTFTPNDLVYTLLVDATVGNITITLPVPTGTTKRRVVKVDATGNTVTIVPRTVGTLILGTYDSVILLTNGTFVELEPVSTGWTVVSARYI